MVEFEKIGLDSIVPAEYNPRFISSDELARLEKSLSTFGMVDPIVVNLRNNRIIGGHQRYEVLKSRGDVDELFLLPLGDIGWCFTSIDLVVEDEAHEKALNIALNKHGGSFVDLDLEPLLSELKESLDDLEVTGFTDDELLKLQIETDIIYDNLDFSDDDIDLEDLYEEPPRKLLKCPKCGNVDDVSFFKRVNSEEG